MESARKRKMHIELESLHLQHLVSHNSLAEYFTKKKNKEHIHDHAAYDYSREYKSHLYVTTICMAYVAQPYNPRSLNACILSGDLKMMVSVFLS